MVARMTRGYCHLVSAGDSGYLAVELTARTAGGTVAGPGAVAEIFRWNTRDRFNECDASFPGRCDRLTMPQLSLTLRRTSSPASGV